MNYDIFHIPAHDTDCGYSLEPPRRGVLYQNKTNNVYPCTPQFYYIKVGSRGSKLYMRVFVIVTHKITKTMMNQSKGLRGDLTVEHKKISNNTTSLYKHLVTFSLDEGNGNGGKWARLWFKGTSIPGNLKWTSFLFRNLLGIEIRRDCQAHVFKAYILNSTAPYTASGAKI